MPESEDPLDANLEEFIGEEILDPWEDPDQLDWPNDDEEGEV